MLGEIELLSEVAVLHDTREKGLVRGQVGISCRFWLAPSVPMWIRVTSDRAKPMPWRFGQSQKK